MKIEETPIVNDIPQMQLPPVVDENQYKEKVVEQLQNIQTETEEDLVEKARKRRQAILDKYKQSQSTSSSVDSPTQNPVSQVSETTDKNSISSSHSVSSPSPRSPSEVSRPASPKGSPFVTV